MNTVLLAILLRPLFLALLALLVFAPVIYAITRWMPDGWLKALLLLRVDTLDASWRQFRSRYWPAPLPIVRDRER